MKKLFAVMLVLGLVILGTAAVSAETITVWGMGEEGKNLDEFAEKFEEENPDIEVEVQAIPWGNAHEKLVTAVAGGTVPDVAQMGTTWMAEFGGIGAFADLTGYLNDSELERGQFFEGSFATNEINEKIYGVPWYVDVRAMYYRSDLLNKVGYENPPASWEELKNASRKLSEEGEYGIDLPNQDEQILLPFIWQNGGEILNEQGEIVIDSPKAVEALEYYVSFFEEDIAQTEAQGSDTIQEFKTGNKPIFFSGPWMIDLIKDQAPEIDGKWSVAMMPEKESRTSFTGGSNLVIFEGSDKKDAAWKFVEFMSQQETQKEWYEATNALPANQDIWQSDYFADQPMLEVFGKQLEDAKAPISVPEWEQVATAIKRRMQQAIYGDATAEESISKLKEDIKGIL